MFRKLLDRGEAGDNVGALLLVLERDGVERGQCLIKPGSVTPHTKFEARSIYLNKRRRGTTYRFLQITDRNSILEQQMLRGQLICLLEQKW